MHLGRIAPPDWKHVEAHPFEVSASPAAKIEKVIARPTLDVYDQGQTPECVGFSISKIMNHFNAYSFDANWLYQQCKLIDGAPTEDGTNARAACDVLRMKGHLRTINHKDVAAGPQKAHGISGNTWATSVDQIRAVFATAKPQPVPIGINWYESWFSPEKRGNDWYLQDIAKAGGIAGGHELGVWAVSDARQALGLSNNWGAWPTDPNDLVWLPYKTMTQLFAEGADAAIISDLPSR